MRTSAVTALCLLLAACSGASAPIDPAPGAGQVAAPPAAPAAPASAPPAAPAAPDPLEAKVRSMAEMKSSRFPSFSPDGKRIAFISDMGGLPEVYVIPTEGGEPARVTSLQDPVGAVAWSPDGAWLALSVSPGGGMNSQVHLLRPDGKDLRRITDGGQENNWLGDFTRDGKALTLSSSRRDRAAMDAYLFDLAGQKLDLVSKNQGTGFFTDVTRDRKSALLTRMRSRSSNDLFLVDVQRGAEVLLTPHEGPGTFWGLFSADGKTVYLISNKDRDRTAFAKIRLGGAKKAGPIEIVAAREDAELNTFALNDQGTTAALSWNVGGQAELAFVDLVKGTTTPGPKLPLEVLGRLRYSADGKLLAAVLSGPAAPADIWVLDLSSGAWRQVTHSPHEGVSLEELVRPQLVRFAAHDGLELSGWLYRPKGESRPGPIVLSFHGGPEGQEVPVLRSDYQALLARGIAVFAPNVRGSWGFGKKFVNLDNGALRVNAVKDIKACVDYVVGAKIADPKRIGIMGGSYGGYMVMAGVTEFPNLFAAGANLFGIVNFATFFKHTEPWMAAISTIEYGDPEKEAEMLRSLSPIHKVDKIVTPILVLHGKNDTNVPVVEAEQVVDNLKKRKIPVDYVLFPDEGHGWQKTPNRIKSTVEITRWFERYLKGGAAGPG